MLHILWMLIKFILILLGILLGLIAFIVLLVLFCPVRYQAAASKEEASFKKAKASARVSWLFGGVSFKLWYEDGSTGRDIRLFGVPVLKLLDRKKNGRKKDDNVKPPAEQKTQAKRLPEQKIQEQKPQEPENKPSPSPAKLQSEETAEASGKISLKPSEPQEDKETAPLKAGFFSGLRNKIRALMEKLKWILKKAGAIPAKIHKFKLTIDQIYAKIQWWKVFLTHPRIQASLALVKDKLSGLLRHVFPTKIEGEISFCCTDPSVTGTVLAVAGATMPLHKNCIRIHPVYEDENRLEGELKLKGRIYGVVLLKTALQLFFNKDLKYSIKKWKKHKED